MCVSISNFACAIPLNCDAKVQTYLETTKQKTKNLCIFNLLQQIKLICAVFIQILSTKLAKCAIYKANFFAFAEYPHTNAHVHYIKTNNKLYLQPFACVFAVCCYRVFCSRINVGSAAKHHHYKRITTCTRFSPPLQIWNISL